MPTRVRRAREAEQIVDLAGAAERVSYSAEYLRKLMTTADPPPLFKRRIVTPSGARWQWHARVADLDAWAAARDDIAS